MDNRPVLSGKTPGGLERLLGDLVPDLPAFRSKQIFQWLSRGIDSFDAMTNLPKALRETLDERVRLFSTTVSDRLEDPDGTLKLQIGLDDGSRIEAVLLVDGEGRRTACISTQAGCPVGCAFCKTGSLGFLRNLRSNEIVEQFLHLQNQYSPISNIVVMGMGEPLLNLDALCEALDVLCAPEGLGLSKRRITLSTSGIISGLESIMERGLPVRLALSLTTADPELRERLMPISTSNPLPRLKDCLLRYQALFGKRITLEAVMLGGLNTRAVDAHKMIDFAKGLDVLVNLIPWNPVEGLCCNGLPLKVPSHRELAQFEALLEKGGLQVQKRIHKGRSVNGACGQLGSLDALGGVPPGEETKTGKSMLDP